MNKSFLLLFSILFLTSNAFAQKTTSPKLQIMPPSGAYKVGHTIIDLVDKARPEPATKVLNDKRQVSLEIWYPSTPNNSNKLASYRPRVEAFRKEWGDTTVHLMKSVSTTYFEKSEIHPSKPFGIFLFSHGWGSRSSSHSTLLSNLASQGYIVVGINHPYMGKVVLSDGTITEPNDNQFENQAAANDFYAKDVVFVINQLKKMNSNKGSLFEKAIDLNKIIAGGHSSGFPAASNAAIIDKRIKGLISFDSGVPKIVRREGLDIPILLVRADTNSYTDLFFRGKNVHPKGSIYDVNFFRTHRSDFYDIKIENTTHSSVYDEYIFAESNEEALTSKRNHRLIQQWILAFHEKILNGNMNTILENNKAKPNTNLRIVKALANQKG